VIVTDEVIAAVRAANAAYARQLDGILPRGPFDFAVSVYGKEVDVTRVARVLERIDSELRRYQRLWRVSDAASPNEPPWSSSSTKSRRLQATQVGTGLEILDAQSGSSLWTLLGRRRGLDVAGNATAGANADDLALRKQELLIQLQSLEVAKAQLRISRQGVTTQGLMLLVAGATAAAALFHPAPVPKRQIDVIIQQTTQTPQPHHVEPTGPAFVVEPGLSGNEWTFVVVIGGTAGDLPIVARQHGLPAGARGN
jgi:hypothetical protein